MSELAIDIFRAFIAGIIFFFLRGIGEKADSRFKKGWVFAIIGFGLFFFGSILDITDNFTELNRYVIVGKTKYEEFLEQVWDTRADSSLLPLVYLSGYPQFYP